MVHDLSKAINNEEGKACLSRKNCFSTQFQNFVNAPKDDITQLLNLDYNYAEIKQVG